MVIIVSIGNCLGVTVAKMHILGQNPLIPPMELRGGGGTLSVHAC